MSFVYLHTSEALFMGEYLEFTVYLHGNTCCGYPFDLPNRICRDFICILKMQKCLLNLQHTTFTDFTATLRNQVRCDISCETSKFQILFPQR